MTTRLLTANWLLTIADEISVAERCATITALSFHPPRATARGHIGTFWQAVAAAAKRGVSVTIIAPPPSKQHPACGMNIGAARHCAEIGATFIFKNLPGLLHAKTALIDGRLAFIGSGNYTAAAAHHNHEAYIYTDDPQPVADLKQFHLSLFSKGITP